MPKPTEHNLAELDRDRCAKRESIQEALRTLLWNVQASKIDACLKCGSNADLKRATLSLFETDETWEVTLPLCEGCALEESGSAVRSNRCVMSEERLQ